MSKFIFIKKPTTMGDDTTVKLTTTACSTSDVLQAFEEFLKGSGFILPQGASIGYEYDDQPTASDES